MLKICRLNFRTPLWCLMGIMAIGLSTPSLLSAQAQTQSTPTELNARIRGT
jgi:hypothetical protein